MTDAGGYPAGAGLVTDHGRGRAGGGPLAELAGGAGRVAPVTDVGGELAGDRPPADQGHADPRPVPVLARGEPPGGGPPDDPGGTEPRGVPPIDTVGDQPDEGPLTDPAHALAAVEAILFVTDEPIGATDLAAVLDLPVPRVEAALRDLAAGYDAASRGIELREVAGGWRLYTRDDVAPWVERYLLDGQRTRLTRAALETLAVIAYRQPVTRSSIAAIRGVGVDAVVRTLLTRGLIEECGTDPSTGGGLYRTTPLFLEKLGMGSLEELPALAPLLPGLEAVDDVIDG